MLLVLISVTELQTLGVRFKNGLIWFVKEEQN
jgi:hypothetical protein